MSKADVAAERKNQIVNATVDCITKFGYHNFSMQDVAKKAGVSKGIIHYYFLNKDDLMMSVLAKVAGDIEDIQELVSTTK
jgi:AcrR family transcriptional regulator